MTADEKSATDRASHAGHAYCFCSALCLIGIACAIRDLQRHGQVAAMALSSRSMIVGSAPLKRVKLTRGAPA
ncbi:MAG: hypothetical protein M1449_00180 [Candidatus Thermoplasmatota archaeon]|nr:hypothetical protein [Candidatus Thermoplasmatota archaeon]